MELLDKLQTLRSKIRNQEHSIETEEATKNAFVMPFISDVLGYDVFNPFEVVPEFTADVGTKKGEKIDYAIKEKGAIRILVECKKLATDLSMEHASQLFRYFTTTEARIAILTNGEVYRFFTDSDEPNKMDRTPFMELAFNDIDETIIPELNKLTKEEFDLDSVLNAAEELKYIGQIKRLISSQFREPEREWVRFFTSRVYDGDFTQRVRDQFTPLVTKAMKQFLNDQVNDRLQSAIDTHGYSYGETDEAEESSPAAPGPQAANHTAETGVHDAETQDELDAYRIVKAIVCSEVAADRIAKRSSKSYFSILLDDNNRKPITRLHFNGNYKYLGVFDSDKKESRTPIEVVEDIYKHASELRDTVHHYE